MTWVIDKSHTEVSFAVQHLMVSTVRGQFTRFDATVAIDTEHPERSTVSAVVDVASLTTGNEERDAHLRSPDFLDVTQYPEIRFASTQVAQVGKDSVWVRGDLTIHGVTREVTLRGRFNGPVPDLDLENVVGFEMVAQFDRRDFGLTWDIPLADGGVFVGRNVTITISAELRESEASTTSSPATVARERGIATE